MNALGQKRILIVEDTKAFQKIWTKQFQSRGFHVILAEDGLAGLNLAHEEVPDLVLLDLMLPKMDGHKVCRLLMFDQRFKHIPIVIFTSRDSDEDAELAKNAKADAFVVKTTRMPIVMDVIERLLEKQVVT